MAVDLLLAAQEQLKAYFAGELAVFQVIARRLSNITREAGDIEAATAAEALYAEHMAKQAKVDAAA